MRANAHDLGIDAQLLNRRFHIHVPAGAIPKDGPSAGVTIATALVSLLTGRKVDETLGMTGEVTLQGRVLPIGGLKEKMLAALRGGVKTVIIPKDNEKDLVDIPDNVKKGLKIIIASTVDEVLQHALTKPLVPIEWNESKNDSQAVSTSDDDSDASGVVRH